LWKLIQEQKRTIADLARRLEEREPERVSPLKRRSTSPKTASVLSRAGLLKTAGVGVGSIVALELTGASTALAESSDSNYVANGPNPPSGVGFDAYTGSGAVFDVGVKGNGTSYGVMGTSYNSPAAVSAGGFFQGPTGLEASLNAGSAGNAVVGDAGNGNGAGAGVYGQNLRGTRGTGVSGFGSGIGVAGGSLEGIGVRGASPGGRGGVFTGGTAPIQLAPSTSSRSHPISGQAGDLFVDRSKRLWFCTRSGSHATWKRIQVA
jgi:hypothetical protein